MVFSADCIFPVCAPPVPGGFVECAPDGTIVSTGDSYDGPEEVIRCRGFLIPGMTNAHCHCELSYMKGMFREASGMDGFITQINALRTTVGRQQRLDALEEAFRRLWEQGVVCMADICNGSTSFPVKSRYLAEGKMYTRSFLELFGTEPEDAPEILDHAASLKAEAEALGLDAAPTPHSCYTMSPLLNRLTAAEGLRSGFLSYHSQESDQEEDMVRYGTGELAEDYRSRGTTPLPVTGTGSLEYFIDNLKKEISAPFPGNILLVHNVATDQQSIDAALHNMAHPFWAVCPLSNVFIHRALPDIDLLCRNGLAICVGTDSLSSNHDLDMIAELRCIQDRFPHIPLQRMLVWACLNGAAFLGKDDIYGSFSPGKKPGVVLIENVDTLSLKLTPESKSKRLI